VIEWLFDLERIRFGEDAPLLLRWANPIEAWMLFCVALAAGAWIVVVYHREATGVGRRVGLASLRCAVVALVVAILCQPVLVLQRNRVEPSYVVLAVDTSQSMSWSDVYEDPELAQSVLSGAGLASAADLDGMSRLELVRRALLGADAAPLRSVLARNGLQVIAFDAATEVRGLYRSTDTATLADMAAALQALTADGSTTDVARAIGESIEKSQGRRLAAVILATDGQSTQPTSLKDALDLAGGRQIPVFPIRFGSPRRPRDVELTLVRAPDTVFVNDVLVVQATVDASGLSEPTEVEVRLVDEGHGATVATEAATLTPADSDAGPAGAQTILLRFRPAQTGRLRLRVEVPPLANEWITENNAESIEVGVIDDRIRVLYVDGYPRYEYRYLKNALLREPTVDLSVLLLQADDRFVQEGTVPIRRCPDSLEELSRFDVVLFGDVDPGGVWLGDAQMEMLTKFVGEQGGGFGLIAGEQAAPQRFADTVLEKLIPVELDPTYIGRYEGNLQTGFALRLTRDGRQSRVFQLAADPQESAQLVSALPEMYWLARTLGAKPGATVLAEHATQQTLAGLYGSRPALLPVIVTGRYGAGKLFFQATDDTWRWRRGNGEFFHDAYWVQVVRELMPDAHAGRDRRLSIRTDQRIYDFAAPVHTTVEFFDPELLTEQGDTVRVAPAASDGLAIADLEPFEAHRLGPDANRFEGTFVPPQPGRYVLTLPDVRNRSGGVGSTAEPVTSAWIRVRRPAPEMRRIEADHAALERIASATGGHVVDLDELEAEFARIRDRSVQIPDDVTEPLWDSKLAFILFIFLICTEWGLRKASGLL
jgi:hypothetical protein